MLPETPLICTVRFRALITGSPSPGTVGGDCAEVMTGGHIQVDIFIFFLSFVGLG